MIHNDRIDRLAALLLRLMNRFRPSRRATVADRTRVARLRVALAVELAEAREREVQRRQERMGFRMADSGLRIKDDRNRDSALLPLWRRRPLR